MNSVEIIAIGLVAGFLIATIVDFYKWFFRKLEQ